MQLFLSLCALLATSVHSTGVAVPGWTYVSTPSSCAATNADPCGPVRSFLLFPLLIAKLICFHYVVVLVGLLAKSRSNLWNWFQAESCRYQWYCNCNFLPTTSLHRWWIWLQSLESIFQQLYLWSFLCWTWLHFLDCYRLCSSIHFATNSLPLSFGTHCGWWSLWRGSSFSPQECWQ